MVTLRELPWSGRLGFAPARTMPNDPSTFAAEARIAALRRRPRATRGLSRGGFCLDERVVYTAGRNFLLVTALLGALFVLRGLQLRARNARDSRPDGRS